MNSGASHTVSMASSSRNQTQSCSNISGKTRIVARIRGLTDHESPLDATSSKYIQICKSGEGGPLEKVRISFDGFDGQTWSHKKDYELDYCYQQNEDTAIIFSREVKPHISRVFDGENSTFIAFGARGSGKTYTIQGSKENLGLGMLAMDEILKIVEGGKHSVVVSFCEVFQDHVYDLLDSKNPEVRVLEDARGKIMLKGLSKVHVKSMLEFQKLYCIGSSLNKPTQKITTELPRRSHKALMIHILACGKGEAPKCVGKMNFVDLAGYENVRRNTIDGTNSVEGTLINKSLNALLNVIHAVNANDSRVPYRESKLARVLQDSLGGNNHISMFVCLNPLFCPDTIHAVTLASRLKSIKPVATCSTTKKQTNARLPLSAKKTNNVLKGRKLFGDTEKADGFKKQVLSMVDNPSNVVKSDISDGDSTVVPCVKEEKCSSEEDLINSDAGDVASAIVPCLHEEEMLVSVATQEMESLVMNKEEMLVSVATQEMESLVMNKEEMLVSVATQEMESLVMNKEDALEKDLSNCKEVNPLINEKENLSPPLSVRLKELSKNLQALCSSTPLSVSRPRDGNIEVVNFVDTMEPKTPIVTHKMDSPNCLSGTFNERSSRLKQSLVKDYLQLLNTADKEDLKGIWGIGEKRASYILELREESPQPFKSLDDLQEIGLSAKQVKKMMTNAAGKLFS